MSCLSDEPALQCTAGSRERTLQFLKCPELSLIGNETYVLTGAIGRPARSGANTGTKWHHLALDRFRVVTVYPVSGRDRASPTRRDLQHLRSASNVLISRYE
jgi:hypothetical protein